MSKYVKISPSLQLQEARTEEHVFQWTGMDVWDHQCPKNRSPVQLWPPRLKDLHKNSDFGVFGVLNYFNLNHIPRDLKPLANSSAWGSWAPRCIVEYTAVRCNAHISQMLWSHVLYVCYTAIHTFNVYVCSIIADSFLKVLGFRLNLLAITLTPGGLQVDHCSSNPTFANICHLHAICMPFANPVLFQDVNWSGLSRSSWQTTTHLRSWTWWKFSRNYIGAARPRVLLGCKPPPKKSVWKILKNDETCKHELTVL